MPGTGLFILLAHVSVAATERRELVQAVLAWLALVRLTPGFANGHVAEDLETPGAYILTSSWHRREDMEAHLVGPDFGVLLGALEVLGRDTHLVMTAATEGAEDGWSHVRELRGCARLLQKATAQASPSHWPPEPGVAPARAVHSTLAGPGES